MEISIQQQALLCVYSILFGIGAGALYDVFRILRIFITFGTIMVFIQDVIYFFICTLCAFVFLFIINDGEIRIYILLSVFIGQTVYYITVGRVTGFIARKAVKLFARIKTYISDFIRRKSKKVNDV